jgi:hypothetical protein
MKRPRYIKNVPCFYEEIYDPRIGDKRKIQVIDAEEDSPFKIERCDVWGSNSKGGKLGHLSKCVQDNAAGRIPGVYLVQTTNSLQKRIYTDNIDVAYRYELDQDGKRVAKINDDVKRGKKDLLKLVPITVMAKPPRWNRSIEYSQSKEMAQLRVESAQRRAGETTRAYATPTESGYRDARRWYARGKTKKR